MELHHLTLTRQAEFLRQKLIGGKVLESFTQQKNETIVRILDRAGSRWDLLLSANPGGPFLLLRDPGKRAKNSTDVLIPLPGNVIKDIEIPEGERIIFFDFLESELRMVIQLFRNRSNFFLINAENRIESAFKKEKSHLQRKFEVNPLNRINPLKISAEDFISVFRESPAQPMSKILQSRFLYFSKLIIEEISVRSASDFQNSAREFGETKLDHLHREIQKFFAECKSDAPRIYLRENYPLAFSLTRLQSLDKLEYRSFETVNDALTFFVYRRLKMDRNFSKKEQLKSAIDRKTAHLNSVIRQLENIPDEKDKRRYYQKIGELLLSQINNVPAGEEVVSLIDYFDENQRSLKVRLNPDLTIQENAARYFEKAKESAGQKMKLEKRLKNLVKRKQELAGIQNELEKAADFRELTRIEKRLREMLIVQSVGEKLAEVQKPYRRYVIKQYEIWVGKNARSNDEMTLHHAHKEDTWLHVQDASGSHVVVRNPHRKQAVPPDVLELAARHAARNSEAKHSSYVPVMVTQVKYVRKPKGAMPGAVSAERTRTIFVEPL